MSYTRLRPTCTRRRQRHEDERLLLNETPGEGSGIWAGVALYHVLDSASK